MNTKEKWAEEFSINVKYIFGKQCNFKEKVVIKNAFIAGYDAGYFVKEREIKERMNEECWVIPPVTMEEISKMPDTVMI